MQELLFTNSETKPQMSISEKNTFYYSVIQKLRANDSICNKMSVLVVGGGSFDVSIMNLHGIENFTLSNIARNDSQEEVGIDGANLPYANGSFDLVFAHATLHHMDRPHSCLCEMYRVARVGVLFIESQDSFLMKIANRLGLVAGYEWNAIIDSNYSRGGINDGPIPNYVYRWTVREVEKVLMTYNPKVTHSVQTFREWDFSPDRIKRRISQRVPILDRPTFYRIVKITLNTFNRVLGKQGNLFGVFVDKRKEELQPWIEIKDSDYRFIRQDS